eukprot:4321384-Pleurochrysis_carterae.AAC.1
MARAHMVMSSKAFIVAGLKALPPSCLICDRAIAAARPRREALGEGGRFGLQVSPVGRPLGCGLD